jgi:hypothetical protein
VSTIRVTATVDQNLPSSALRQMRDSLFSLYTEAVSRCISEVPAGRVAASVLNNASATSTEVFDAFINLHREVRA